jgi:hypothetical protein
LRANPEEPEALGLRGTIAALRGRLPDAIALLEAAAGGGLRPDTTRKHVKWIFETSMKRAPLAASRTPGCASGGP